MNKIGKHNIEKLKRHNKRDKVVNIDGTTFKYMGSGGQGHVFKVDNIAVKIYKNTLNRKIIDEMIYLKMCRYALDKRYTPNLIRYINDKYIGMNLIISMEHLTGTLERWAAKSKSTEEWRSMLFQMIQSVCVINNVMYIQHNDMKPKNIMYVELDKPKIYRYIINGTSYYVPIKYLFKLIDFGQSVYNSQKRPIDIPTDLSQVFIVHNRHIVNLLVDTKSKDELMIIAKKSDKFTDYYIKEKKHINKIFKSFNKTMYERIDKKAIAYFILEHDLLDISEFKEYLPDKSILDAMVRFRKMNFIDLFNDSIFDIYKKEINYDEEFSIIY